jgi:Lon protease-like protein
MIGECLEFKAPFGVLLIKEGQEVGHGAVPYSVGTSARITQAQKLDDGRYTLQTVGERRFRLLETTQEYPFLMGKVQYLDDIPSDDYGDIVPKARQLLGDYWRLLASAKGGWISNIDTPTDPVALSHALGQAVARPPKVGQYLLQMDSVKERLEKGLPLLQEKIALAKKELERIRPFQGPRLN